MHGVAFAVALTWGFLVLAVVLAPPLVLTEPQLLGVLVATPFLAALLGGLPTPLTMPEAVERGWLGHLEAGQLPVCLACLPFLQGSRIA